MKFPIYVVKYFWKDLCVLHNQNFFGSLFAGIDEEKLRQFCDVFEQLRTNLDNNRKEGKY